MAWTETCKIDFHKQIEHKKEQGYKTKDALVELSNDSGIPIGTLKNWLYPESRKKALDAYQEKSCKTTTNLVEEFEEIDKAAYKQKLEVVREIAAEKKEIRAEQREERDLEEQLGAEKYDAQPQDENIQILHGDFRELCLDIPENSVDLVLTDPPYPKEFLPLWSDLSFHAERILKPSGFCIAYSGQMHIQEVLNRMSEHLNYYWTFCLYHTGGSMIVNHVNVMNKWKPVLIYQKSPREKIKFTDMDYVVSEKREKDNHKWQRR